MLIQQFLHRNADETQAYYCALYFIFYLLLLLFMFYVLLVIIIIFFKFFVQVHVSVYKVIGSRNYKVWKHGLNLV